MKRFLIAVLAMMPLTAVAAEKTCKWTDVARLKAHVQKHITYPATGRQVKDACRKEWPDEFSEQERACAESKLKDEATFKDSATLLAALGVPSRPGRAALVPASEIRFEDVAGSPGVQLAVVEGDAGKGAHHSFLKLAAGFSAPDHHHSANHYVTVVAGTLVLVVDGKEQRLPPGSYFSFAGRAPHSTRCDAGADCLLFIDARERWDVVLETAGK